MFTREAVMLIHERSRGIPRTDSVIADNALVTAFALGRKPVNSQVIAEVCRDLDLQPAKLADRRVGRLMVEGGPAHRREDASARAVAVCSRSASGEADARRRQELSATTEPKPEPGLFNNFFRKRRRFSIFSKRESR